MSSNTSPLVGLSRIIHKHIVLVRGWAKTYPYRLASLGVVLIGVGLRLYQFLYRRSLWLDEASLALNIIHRPYRQLLQPLDYHQGAPLGFLFAERFAVNLIGNNEYALRLVPFLAGTLSLVFFYLLARDLLSDVVVLIAVICFSFSHYLVYYSAETKQYAVDVFCALLIWYWGVIVATRPVTWRRTLGWSVIGVLTVWFSHSAVFVLTGVGAVLFVRLAFDRSWPALMRLTLASSIWMVNGLALYFVSIRHLAADPTLLRYWAEGMAPHPITSIQTASWLAHTAVRTVRDPAGLAPTSGLLFALIALGACTCGAVVLLRKNPVALALLLAPLALTFVASILGKYPFQERLILFLAPAILLLAASCTSQAVQPAHGLVAKTRKWLAIVLVSVILLTPVRDGFEAIVHPITRSEVRPIFEDIVTHWAPGDGLYLHYTAIRQYQYYKTRLNINAEAFVLHIPRAGCLDEPLPPSYWTYLTSPAPHRRANGRIWLVFTRWTSPRAEEQVFYTSAFATWGRLQSVIRTPGAVAYLYDITGRGMAATQAYFSSPRYSCLKVVQPT
jgi:Dolichyl-phosphate-mannose-protein mannosyltransferase